MFPAGGRQHRGCVIPQTVTHKSRSPEDGRNNCPKHVELTGIINKPLLLHLVGCLYYLYQWCTVKQISDNEIYLLVKYIKSVLWRVVKRLSLYKDARCLKVNQEIQYILEFNPHPFYSFRGLKSQMWIRIACGLDSRSWADFGKMIEPLYVP